MQAGDIRNDPMDVREARVVLADKLNEYRRLPHAVLRDRVGDVETFTVFGRSGVEYQIEVQFAREGGDVRVLGSVYDGGLRAFFPVCDSFCIASDWKVVGERDG
jgi:hypothetical protein